MWMPGRLCALACLDVLLPPDQALPPGLDDLLGEVTCAVLRFGRAGGAGHGEGPGTAPR